MTLGSSLSSTDNPTSLQHKTIMKKLLLLLIATLMYATALAEGTVKEEIDLSAMPQGVYAVTYIAGDNVIGTVKFTR